MKLQDFDGADFIQHGEIQLSEWVINGEHFPTVKTYHNNKTNECFQVAEKHKKFRRTPPSNSANKVVRYGEWEDLQ